MTHSARPLIALVLALLLTACGSSGGGGTGDGGGDGGGTGGGDDPAWFAYDQNVSFDVPEVEGIGVALLDGGTEVVLDGSTPSGWTFTMTRTAPFVTGSFNTDAVGTGAGQGGFTLTATSGLEGACVLDDGGDANNRAQLIYVDTDDGVSGQLTITAECDTLTDAKTPGQWTVSFATDRTLIGASRP